MAKKWLIVELNWHTSGTLRIKSPLAMWGLWMFSHPEMTAKPDTSMPTRHTSVRGWDSKHGICSWTYWRNHDRKSWEYKYLDKFAEAIDAGISTELEAQNVCNTAAKALKRSQKTVRRSTICG